MSTERLHLIKGNMVSDDTRLNALLESPLIQRTEVMGTREGGIVDCWVPTELIDHEEVPVKEEWASSLANEMREIADTRGGTGQLSPVILGLIEGEDSLKIMDGFHRDAALKINGEGRIYSAVQLTDWDGLYDVRIFTAKDHAHVRFSRVVQWIREVWAYSGLDDKMTLEQAILLYRYGTSGSKLGLRPEEVGAANAWVARKEQQWDMAAMTIHAHLKVAETVDPKLVHSAREKKKNDVLEAPTQVILRMFADQIPNDFKLQNLVMEQAMAHNLTGPEVRSLCSSVRDKTLEEAQAVMAAIDWDNWEPKYSVKKQRALRRAHDARYKGANVFARAGWEIQSISRRAKLSAERDEEIDFDMVENIREAIQRANSLQAEIGKVAVELGSLIREEAPAEDLEVIDESVEQVTDEPEQLSEPTSEEGLREDIISYLTGENDLGSVRPFTKKQLVECFRGVDALKDQPKGWRDRFARVQQANLSGKPSH
jgi:anti-sigma28 factor (negative regulator of flagellin synthesis)